MDFRRIPFQFSSTDPAKRQAELQKRFGLPVNTDKEKMHIDFNDPGLMGIRPDGSPRLQHRIPIFKEGSPEPTKSSVDSQGSPVPGRKPHVRVVPIEIEGGDNVPKRHRNLPGLKTHFQNGFPAYEPSFRNGFSWLPDDLAATTKPPAADPKPNPGERTIPIKIDCAKKAKTIPVKKTTSPLKKEAAPMKNGCAPSKADKASSKVDMASPKIGKEPGKPPKLQLTGIELSKKKIDGVLEKLPTYHADVEKFTGTVKEKQYRYLDEMLTRLMLELDDVDTMGNEEVRLARKAAVRQVQASVDLLEARVTRKSADQRPEGAAEDKDVEMELSSSQDQNGMPISEEGNGEPISDSTMSEDQSQVVTEPVVNEAEIEDVENTLAEPKEDQSQAVVEPVLDQVKNVQDIEMGNEAEVKTQPEIPEEVSREELVVEKDKEPMEVDSEPIVTTSTDEPQCSEQKVMSDVQIEEVDGESSDSEPVSSAKEPLVSLPDSPVKDQSNNIELDSVPEEPALEESTKETEIISDSTKCVAELVTTACNSDVSGKRVSNLEDSIPNGLSNNLISQS